MTAEEVRLLISDKLISIGAHSVTHPALTELQAEARRFEIVNSKRACEVLSAKQVSAFAYPFGSVDASVRNDICEAGLRMRLLYEVRASRDRFRSVRPTTCPCR